MRKADLDTLFDRGYITVTPQYGIEVSRRIKEEWSNGKEYHALQRSEIMLPEYSRWWENRGHSRWRKTFPLR
jgi:putative restriction endonuclease